jgi:predicted metal-dependent peptidase
MENQARMSSRILENAIIRLLQQRPFYGHFLLGLRREENLAPYPVGITIRNGTPLLTFNSHSLALLTPEEQEALLEHGIKHLLHLHMSRCKGRNRHDWDICCDLAINPTISGLPPEAPQPESYKVNAGLAAEEYYALLVPPFDSGNLEGSGIGNASRDVGGQVGNSDDRSGSTIDDHTLWHEADSTPLKLAEEMVRSLTRDSVRKCDGAVPPELSPLVASLLAPAPIPWRQILRQFVATAGRVGRSSTWQRENRRFSHITPGIRKRHRLALLIAIDVSDSTNAPELRNAFARELLHIARGREAQLTVLYANSRIQRIDSFKGSAISVASYHGGGFTDLRPVFEHARGMHPQPAAIIYLTDGIGPAPEKMTFPTLWVLTREGDKPVPWGVELRLDL